MLTFRSFIPFMILALLAQRAFADGSDGISGAGQPPPAAAQRPSAEVNVLWPFFPGGIFEARFVVPVVRARERSFGGAVVLGAYSDFASRVVRDETHGKVGNLSAKLGWRQYFVHGLHLEASVNAGWRREVMRPGATEDPIDGFQVRLWLLPGWEYDFAPPFYANTRGAVGIHLLRTGPYAELEKRLAFGADLNFGVRF